MNLETMPYNTYRYRKEKQTNILQLAQSWFGLDIEIILDVVVEEKGVVEEIHGDVVEIHCCLTGSQKDVGDQLTGVSC